VAGRPARTGWARPAAGGPVPGRGARPRRRGARRLGGGL
ncbi:MAG: hypothetical protein AVDCRST_MAG07-3388, partial [uncultured Frankineae bacterium]